MSGVLHPVGPEPAATYWLRRALVLGVLGLVAVVVTALSTPEPRHQQAVPSANSAPPVADATPTTSVPAADTDRSPSVSVSSPAAAKPKPAKSSSATKHAKVKAAKSKPGASRASASPAATKSKRSAAAVRKAAPPGCAARQLRTTLTGREQLKVQQPATFGVSVINGSPRSCLVRVTADNFEVTIHSGTDRIWSTRDCARAVGSHQQQRASQESMAWQLAWNGRRSATECKSRPETLRPGTYVVTAQLKGADPVRFRMVLHG